MILKAGTKNNDQPLVEKARAGSQRAFGQLVKLHQDYILYLAYDFVGNYQDAKDIAQESFLQAYQKLSQYKGTGPFRAWLSRITINLCKAHFRKSKKHSTISVNDGKNMFYAINQESSEDLQKKYEDKDMIKHINAYVDRLSVNQQTAIILKYYQNKSSREIAAIMGCAESTVRIHLSRGIRMLRKFASGLNKI